MPHKNNNLEDTPSPLFPILCEKIEREGALSVAEYMALCLTHPEHGYYTGRNPLGRMGDFTTAPEISQIFGELIGSFLVQNWMDMGQPQKFAWVEIGPGRGTLMADMLRMAEKLSPDFCTAAQIHLVEISPVLRAAQQNALAAFDKNIVFHDDINTLPDDMPLLCVGNEFFDALPIRQFIYQDKKWQERGVTSVGDELRWTVLAGTPDVDIPAVDAPEGTIYETCAPAEDIMHRFAQRIQQQHGMAIFIDYSYVDDAFGDTFQAVAKHRYVDPLDAPGQQDLTAHVDFGRLRTVAEETGVAIAGPMTQGDFLNNLGAEAYVENLRKNADKQQAEDLTMAYHRLTSSAEMGLLFKVLGISA